MGRRDYMEEHAIGRNQFPVLIHAMKAMKWSLSPSLVLSLSLVLLACEGPSLSTNSEELSNSILQEIAALPIRTSPATSDSLDPMVLIPSGTFMMGATKLDFAFFRCIKIYQLVFDSKNVMFAESSRPKILLDKTSID